MMSKLLNLLSLLVFAGPMAGADQAEERKHFGTVIGIDLGTSYSSVGVFRNGRVQIIPNEQGSRITPSYVAFTAKGEHVIGDFAMSQLTMNPKNTVFNVKRIIGRNFSDKSVQHDIKWLPYTVVYVQNKPHIQVQVGFETRTFAPEEISAMVLGQMKKIAEAYLKVKVTQAVISVPANFNNAQRQATIKAAKIAGLAVIRLLNEPSAAAVAYYLDKKTGGQKKGEKNILVFDMGGGSCDVSLLTVDNGVFEVKATSGDTHIGGEDFNQRVMDYFIRLVKKKTGKDLRTDERAMQKLRREVERAKRFLSSDLTASIEIESFYDGVDFSETLTRARSGAGENWF